MSRQHPMIPESVLALLSRVIWQSNHDGLDGSEVSGDETELLVVDLLDSITAALKEAEVQGAEKTLVALDTAFLKLAEESDELAVRIDFWDVERWTAEPLDYDEVAGDFGNGVRYFSPTHATLASAAPVPECEEDDEDREAAAGPHSLHSALEEIGEEEE